MMSLPPRTTVVLLCPLLCLIGGLLASPVQAQTVPRSFSLNPYGAEIAQGSSGGPGARFSTGFSTNRGIAGILMPDPTGGTSKFSLGITLPLDYAPGTPFYLKVLWRSEASSCVVDLRNNFTNWSQPGQLNRSGALVRQTLLEAPADNRISVETLFLFNFVPAANFAPGDALVFGLFRSATNDTCADNVYIQGLSIEYEALTAEMFADGFETLS